MMENVANALLPTRYGNFRIYAFKDENGREDMVLVACDHKIHDKIPLRIHSKCFTGDTLCSLRCDCRAQLEEAMEYIAKKKCGMIIYLDQEGRGIGLANKIKAYALQDQGYDTIEANQKLGFESDLRDYNSAADILKQFGITTVEIITNNPKKIEYLENNGITVAKRIPIITKSNKHNKKYLKTKKEKMEHML
ncbi:GTP cyclohydrolase II [Candidatus Micrarchaeota archaeon]|nr:GTP cyclohydrolase II [Candidatus Micrarchaeota archaeon]